MTVVVFNTWDDYRGFMRQRGFLVSEGVPGVYDQRTDQCVLFNFANAALIRAKRDEIAKAKTSVSSMKASDGRSEALRSIHALEREVAGYIDAINATVVRHEIAHQVLARLAVHRPGPHDERWLTEGLAMQFETDEPLNTYRLADLSSAKTKRPDSLRNLLTDPTFLGPGAKDLSTRYATAWALVRYLADQRRAEFVRFLRSRTGGANAPKERPSALAAFERAFGAFDADFERKCWNYIEGIAAHPVP